LQDGVCKLIAQEGPLSHYWRF